MNNGTITDILSRTAWQMDTPQLFGRFHLAASLLAAAAAVLAAVLLSRRAASEKRVRTVLVLTGWILVVLEIYKQLFLYFVVNDGAYDFWFFPFQLCSVPMYLCMILPLINDDSRVTLMNFMGGYTFVSSVAALAYPEDMLRPYIALTVHGFVWHGLLLFISLLIFFSGSTDAGAKALRGTAVLFVILSAIALGINMAAEQIMPAIRAAHPAVAHGWTAMFYLNPFHYSPQPVISAIQKTAGIPAGLVLYLLVIAFVSSAVIKFFNVVSKRWRPISRGSI